MYVYRGYYISSALFSIIFILFLKLEKKFKQKNIKLICFFSALLLIHSLFTIYLVIPIMLVLLFLSIKKIKLEKVFLIFFIYFFIPFLIFYSLSILVTGIYFGRLFSDSFDFLYFFKNGFSLFVEAFLIGVKPVFFPPDSKWILSDGYLEYLYTITSTQDLNLVIDYELPQKSYFVFEGSKIIGLYLICLFVSIYKIATKTKVNSIDFVVLLFFVTFLLIDRAPWIRVFIGFIFFFIFYLFYNFNLLKNLISKMSKLYLKSLQALIFFLLMFMFYNLELKTYITGYSFEKEQKNLVKYLDTCQLTEEKLDYMNKLLFYYLYLNKCKKKYDLNEFHNYFAKNRGW